MSARPAARRAAVAPIVGAAMDVGSNSVHLLVAVTSGHRLQPLVDESVLLGLGSIVDANRFLGAVSRLELVAALVRNTETARRLGAGLIVVVGTEPMRRAADAARVVGDVERAAGVGLHVLTPEEEGLLTLLGVTGGRRLTVETLVVDIGGGSSELVMAGPGRRAVAGGIRIGAARLTDRHVRHDPPTRAELASLRDAAQAALGAAPDGAPVELIAVGGTVSNLLRIHPAATLDRTLTRSRIGEAIEVLVSEPASAAAERHAVNLMRARILPAGAAIVDAILERYRADRIRVLETGVREGAVLAAAHAGRGWRDALAVLAAGWR